MNTGPPSTLSRASNSGGAGSGSRHDSDPFYVAFGHPLLQQLPETDYPHVQFWHRKYWKPKSEVTQLNNDVATRGKSLISNGINVQYRFVEDENGDVYDGWKIGQITSLMREVWREFEHRNRAPPKWGMVPTTLNNFMRITVYQRFPDLRLCEGHWKIDYIATHTYSGWGGEKLPAPVKPVKKEVRSAKPAKKEGEYMHLPQKRLPTQSLPDQKSKKFKIPTVPKPHLDSQTISMSSGERSDISASTLSSPTDDSSTSLPPVSPVISPPLSPVVADSSLKSLSLPLAADPSTSKSDHRTASPAAESSLLKPLVSTSASSEPLTTNTDSLALFLQAKIPSRVTPVVAHTMEDIINHFTNPDNLAPLLAKELETGTAISDVLSENAPTPTIMPTPSTVALVDPL